MKRITRNRLEIRLRYLRRAVNALGKYGMPVSYYENCCRTVQKELNSITSILNRDAQESLSLWDNE